MSAVHLGGFALVATIAAGAVDYVNQARHADPARGAFGPSAYVATIGARIRGEPSRAEAEVEAPAPAPQVLGTGADGNCTLAGGVKRCSLGGG